MAYVAFTRAKEHLVLLSSKGKASRFLAEAWIVDSWEDTVRKREAQRRAAAARARARVSGHGPAPEFAEGEVVVHPMFGQGVVVSVNGQQLDVRFADGRHLVSASRRLRVL